MIRVLMLTAATLLFGCSKPGTSSEVQSERLRLTVEEIQYIREHNTVTWAMEENRPPFVYREHNKIKGISHEYLKVISRKTGLNFKAISVNNLAEAIDSVDKGKVDIVTSVRATPKRSEFMLFSTPYVYNAGVFVFRQNSNPRSPLRAGICRGDASSTYLKERFTDMRITETRDVEEAISLLEKGLLDVAVMNEASADYLSNKSIIRMRKANTDFDYPYSFGVHKENEILVSILTKAIDSISIDDKNQMNEAWKKEMYNGAFKK